MLLPFSPKALMLMSLCYKQNLVFQLRAVQPAVVGPTALNWKTQSPQLWDEVLLRAKVSIRPCACFFPFFSFLPLCLHNHLNPLCVQSQYFLVKVRNCVVSFPSLIILILFFSYLMVVVVIKFRLPVLASILLRIYFSLQVLVFSVAVLSGLITFIQMVVISIKVLTVFVVRSSGIRVLACQGRVAIFFLTVPVADCISFIGARTNTVWNAAV